MRILLLSALTLLAAPSFAELPAAGEPVDARDFFRSIVGSYSIEMSGPAMGEMHPVVNYTGTIEMDGDEVFLAFPYCPDGQGCLPGYVFLNLTTTRAVEYLGMTFVEDGTESVKWAPLPNGKKMFTNYRLETKPNVFEAIVFQLLR